MKAIALLMLLAVSITSFAAPGGHYRGGRGGSSHKGSHYVNHRTGNHYVKHK